jgi:hypothetical protein
LASRQPGTIVYRSARLPAPRIGSGWPRCASAHAQAPRIAFPSIVMRRLLAAGAGVSA